MINEVLTAAGFVENVTFIQTAFTHPPTQPFAVFFDDVTTDGSDYGCELSDHSVRIELYSPSKPATEKERAIEAAFTQRGIHYNKTGRTWINSERYYLTVYEFDYIEKEI